MSINIKELLSRFLPVLLWALVIFVFSANPDPFHPLRQSWSEPSISATTITPTTPTTTPKTFSKDEFTGNLLHVGEYLILAFLVCRMIVWRNKITSTSIITVIGLSSIYAISDEIHQQFVPGRAFQVSDLVLDFAGILVGALIFHFITRTTKKRVPRT